MLISIGDSKTSLVEFYSYSIDDSRVIELMKEEGLKKFVAAEEDRLFPFSYLSSRSTKTKTYD